MRDEPGTKQKVFISSTRLDLVDEREAVYRALLPDFGVIRMEDFGSDPDPPLVCLAGVEASDAYVLLRGRYGSVAPEAQISYTHAEYEHARKLGRPVYAYVQSDFDVLLDTSSESELARTMLQDLRNEVESSHVVHRPYFESVDDLVDQVIGDLTRWREGRSRRPAFGRSRRTVRNTEQYARAVVSQSLLQLLHPYRVVLVDLAAIESRNYPAATGRRLSQKLRYVFEDLAAERVNVLIFNELPVDDLSRGTVFI